MNMFYNLFSLQSGEQDKTKVKTDIINNISFRGANLWILACAIFIASIGLNVNSYAVIIGAMLISPLMGPIVGSGFALATYDFELLKRTGKNLLIATIVGFTVSTIYFYLSPFKEVQSELLARTSPNIYDVLIAFFGGIVGAVSITRVEKGNPIPGVAIATALLPPLCTAGFGLATLNMKFMAGALYLYCINCFFIGISTFLVIKLLKYQPISTENKVFDRKVKRIITFLILLITFPSLYLAYGLLQEKRYSQNVDKFIQNKFTDEGYAIIYKKFDFNSNPKKIQIALLAKTMDSTEIMDLNNDLKDYNLQNTVISIMENSKNIKNEILSEINSAKSINNINEIKVQSLNEELKKYKIGNNEIVKEAKIIFPEIDSISFGTVVDYYKPDSSNILPVVLYWSANKIDETMLKEWLSTRLSNTHLEIFRRKNR